MPDLNRFQKLVAEAKKNITEIPPNETKEQLDRGAVVIDVREESDWREGHIKGAKHLSRGIIELEIEDEIPDVNQPIICYCGGGS
ncbi:MAG: rhodanese-like domain-containing protein, partial [Chthoniobacterales bacterium]